MSAPNQPSVGKNSSTTSEVSLANSSEIDCLGEERIESDGSANVVGTVPEFPG